MRVVIDTNVLYAAITFEHGLCANLMLACLNRFDVILSDHILGELRRNLIAKARVSEGKFGEISSMFRDGCLIIVPTALPVDSCRDPDDVPVLGTATAGRADVLVTGDKDLLSLQTFQGVSILSPRQFTDRFLAT